LLGISQRASPSVQLWRKYRGENPATVTRSVIS
jgi:hypothetical protein